MIPALPMAQPTRGSRLLGVFLCSTFDLSAGVVDRCSITDVVNEDAGEARVLTSFGVSVARERKNACRLATATTVIPESRSETFRYP